ncbi:MAG: formate dehydrogenase accessory sulfurtransferase FdhD [Coriobacteriia bacterium]|nr:formate dehydrogenase accessory sulfurtransferase FdhD [Coriobacteriia bacterium]
MSNIENLSKHSLPLTAVILAGGRSLRMGVDKTQVDLSGIPLLAHAVNNASDFASQIIIVTNRPDSIVIDDFQIEVEIVTDEIAYQGPLGGLSTALKVAQNEWVVALAADMPWVSKEVISALWDARGDGSAGNNSSGLSGNSADSPVDNVATNNFDVVVPVSDNGPEPLLALYRRDSMLQAAQEVLDSGKRRIIAAYPALHVHEINLESLQQVDPHLISFYNVNTQTDLMAARKYEQARKAADERSRSSDTKDTDTDNSADELLAAQEIIPHDFKRGDIRVLSLEETGRSIPTESPFTIYLNDVEIATVQASDDDLEDMAVGFLLAEGLLHDRSAFKSVDLDAKRGLIYVGSDELVPEDLVYRTRYITSGCGKGITFSSLGHARGLEKITQELKVSPHDLYYWMSELSKRSAEHRERGGYHSCGLVLSGELQLVREDIGRHNAVDKLLGQAWLEGMPIGQGIVLVSGRISYEMIVKAAKSKIPFIASRSAATDLAAEIAQDLGITLVGYVRGGKMVAYTHPERIANEGSDA